MAFASVDERFLYIQGGLTEVGSDQTPASQFIALDLTVDSWSTSAPPWVWPQSLGVLPPTSSGHSMTVARERDTLFIWDPFQASAWWSYTIGANVWNYYANSLNTTKQSGIKNGVDMNTGNVYIPSGNNNGLEMIMNTPGNPSVPTSPMPTALIPVPVVHESFVWSTYRNSFLHYGGRAMFGNTGNPYLNEFSPTSGWASVVPLLEMSAVIAWSQATNGGSKMIVFGGAGVNGIAKADIHILDVRTREWTAGKPVDANQARQYMACAVSGDSFIAWGGEMILTFDSESASRIKDATPIVYDMKNNQWTTQFNRFIKAISTTTGPSAVTPSPNSIVTPSSQSDAAKIAAIGGGIAGAVVAVIAIVGFLLCMRRSRQTRKTKATRKTGNIKDKQADEKGVNLANLRELPPNSNVNAETEPLPSSYPPPLLKPRPTEDRDACLTHLSTTPSPTEPLAGPQAVLRVGSPQGHQQPIFTNSSMTGGVDINNEAHHRMTLFPGLPSNQSDNTNTFKGGADKPQSLRNPQSRSSYEERSQELTRMMANLRAEQEELERVSVRK
ncbi:hypothetical protein BG015_002514 [Linnemannia schmuckeri]|uniref:Kelch repeat-containing protein n=1 Tax=Linnemannia schmuckeri TaxID=64567 RepID=A0A9P5S303_9FUNG|nr:hypothetical protein BG015_002514 [Linnemannia schmuckeri]